MTGQMYIYRQHSSNYFGVHKGFLSSVNRLRVLLNGRWGERVNQLFYLLDNQEFKEMNLKHRQRSLFEAYFSNLGGGGIMH